MLINEIKLENGLTLIHKEMTGIKIATVQLWIKTGSYNENKDNNGISHFLEHLVFKGTKNFKPDEIDLYVESNGGQLNAATGKDFTYYYVTIPVKDMSIAFQTISDMGFNALFIPEEIEKEKPVIIQEYNRKFDNPTHEMWKYLNETLYHKTPYEADIIGTKENILKFDKDMLLEYYKTHYHPENMTLVVAGDIDFEKTKELSNEFFNIPADLIQAEKRIIKQNDLKNNSIKIFEKEVNQVYKARVYKAPSLKEKEKCFALDVLSEILSGGEHCVLNKILKYENMAVNYVFGGFHGQKYGGAMTFYFSSDPDNYQKADDLLAKFIDEIKSHITENELTKAKNRLKSQICFQREKCYMEANDIGHSYSVEMPDYYHNYIDNIEKVSTKYIHQVMDDILSKPYCEAVTKPV